MRTLRWLLWAIVLVNVGLALLDLVEAWVALVTLVITELIALVLAGALSWRGLRTAREATGPREAILTALSALLPVPLARFTVLEFLMFWTLSRWLSWRPLPPYAFAVAHRPSFGMLLVPLLAAPVGSFLFAWGWIRWIAIGLSLYRLLWLVALRAGFQVWPHTIDGKRLVLRWLFLHEIVVPLSAIRAAVVESRDTPASRGGLTIVGGVAYLTARGHTNLRIDLSEPRTALRCLSTTEPFRTIYLDVERPEHFRSLLTAQTERMHRT